MYNGEKLYKKVWVIENTTYSPNFTTKLRSLQVFRYVILLFPSPKTIKLTPKLSSFSVQSRPLEMQCDTFISKLSKTGKWNCLPCLPFFFWFPYNTMLSKHLSLISLEAMLLQIMQKWGSVVTEFCISELEDTQFAFPPSCINSIFYPVVYLSFYHYLKPLLFFLTMPTMWKKTHSLWYYIPPQICHCFASCCIHTQNIYKKICFPLQRMCNWGNNF